MEFYKYQGTGNDFVIIDNLDNSFKEKSNIELIAKICDRRFGIGADGFMILEKAEGYDFRMVYYNSDGRESSMCGNGGRCIVKFAYDQGIVGDKCSFIAIDGPHEATVHQELVSLKMIDVGQVEKGDDFFYLDTGSPHYVRFVDNLADYDVDKEGAAVRYNERFQEVGTNVNFVEQLGDDKIFVRTYERGVEGETLSCGTGVTACAIASSFKNIPSPLKIKVLGGELEVLYSNENNTEFKDLYLKGPAEFVFKGDYKI